MGGTDPFTSLHEKESQNLNPWHKQVGKKKLYNVGKLFLRNNSRTKVVLTYFLPFKECHLKILNPLNYPKGKPHVHDLKKGGPTLEFLKVGHTVIITKGGPKLFYNGETTL